MLKKSISKCGTTFFLLRNSCYISVEGFAERLCDGLWSAAEPTISDGEVAVEKVRSPRAIVWVSPNHVIGNLQTAKGW